LFFLLPCWGPAHRRGPLLLMSCVLRTTEKADSVDQWNAVGVSEEAWILCEDEDPFHQTP
jgi:hypothetical protein